MFILKNAWISITRNKGRNILIGVIILIIACASTVTLAIKSTATDLINSYVESYAKEVSITFNRSNMMKNFNMSEVSSRDEAKTAMENIKTYSIEDIKEYAESDHIEGYYYTYSISLNGNNIAKATSEIDSTQISARTGKNSYMEGFGLDFTLVGYSSIESMSEFINGTYTMTDITDDAWDLAFTGNYIFVNEELASYNELNLNDKVILEDENGSTYEFEIIGIYQENTTAEEGLSMFSSSANNIITNADALLNITSQNDTIKSSINPKFIIDSYDNLELVEAEFTSKGLDEAYTLVTNEEEAKSAVSGVSNVNSFATTFLVITLIIGGCVLFVINMINIRERKYEIGVLRTIGMSKSILTTQFTTELLIVAFVALLLGAGLGSFMSKSVSNSLLENEIQNSTQKLEAVQNNFGGKGMMNTENRGNINKMLGTTTVEAYTSINAVVDITVIFELLTIGLLLVLISSLAAMISIQRFTPLTILKERS